MGYNVSLFLSVQALLLRALIRQLYKSSLVDKVVTQEASGFLSGPMADYNANVVEVSGICNADGLLEWSLRTACTD